MEIKERIARLERAALKRTKRAGNCRCWDGVGVIVDFGGRKAEYPPDPGAVCPKCGKIFRGVPGGYLVIK